MIYPKIFYINVHFQYEPLYQSAAGIDPDPRLPRKDSRINAGENCSYGTGDNEKSNWHGSAHPHWINVPDAKAVRHYWSGQHTVLSFRFVHLA